MSSTYSLKTARDVIFTTETISTSLPQQNITSFQNSFQTLSQTKNLFKIQAREIILTQKPGSTWPLINTNLVNPALNDTDYFLQITIPNVLRPLEVGNSNKSQVFTIIDLRELFDSNSPQKITFADFKPIVYRFYQPTPEAYFNDFNASYSTMDVQFTNSINVDHPILKYVHIKLKCHIEGLEYALAHK
jgi:hypothetical protein